MPAPDLPFLVGLAEEAGTIARRFFRQSPRIWHKPDNQGPVTIADLDIDRMIKARMRQAYPDVPILSEESEDDPSRLNADRLLIIDPIDGTNAFIKGEPWFSHAIALIENGQPVAAAIHAPMLNATWAAQAGQGATKNGEKITCSSWVGVGGARILTSTARYNAQLFQARPLPFTTHFRASLAIRLCLAADGSFDAMATLRPSWDWDLCAGDLIVREAGGATTQADGNFPTYNRKTPQQAGFIAGAPRVVNGLLSRVQSAK